MLVEDGTVLARRRAGRIPAEGAIRKDLKGAFLAPCFIDSHCHILPMGLDLRKLHLGPARSHEDVLNLVRQAHQDQPEGWLLAVHYDQTRYEDGYHLTRSQLDSISATRPILLRHSNGHASVANSAALVAAGLSRQSPDPNGGRFGRDSVGDLDGTLFEEAHELVSNAAPVPNLEQMVEAIILAGDKMRSLGISCASDMMTGRFDLTQELEAYRLAALRGCQVRTRLYLQWRPALGPRGPGREVLKQIVDDLDRSTCGQSKVAGIKIFADGAIGSATAAIYGSYIGQEAIGQRRSRSGVNLSDQSLVSGQLIYSPERLREMVRCAGNEGYQVAVHAIGDYAADLVMDAFEATGESRRHRLEHAMLLSDHQIARLANLDPFVTFQPEFLMRFGHSYNRQLGAARASMLKRVRSVLDSGVRLSFSSDRPIVPGDPWDGIRTACERPAGFDSSENCTVEEALRAYTAGGADVNGDGKTMGRLDEGMQADFQLLPCSLAEHLGNAHEA